jgi:hypothetical protein
MFTKQNITSLIIIFIFSTCGISSSFESSMKHLLSIQTIRIMSYAEFLSDIKEFKVNEDSIIRANNINLILLKDDRFIQFLNDTLIYNSLDSSLNMKLNVQHINDWEDTLSLENTQILLKLVIEDKGCFVGSYQIVQDSLLVKRAIKRCDDLKTFADSIIWKRKLTKKYVPQSFSPKNRYRKK